MVGPMVGPAALGLAPEGDRVEDRVFNPVITLAGGRTIRGVRAQLKARQVDRVCKGDPGDKAALPVSRVYIPSGRRSVPKSCRGKTAALPIPTAVVVRVVVGAMVGGGQTPAEGLAAPAIESVSQVNFRHKVSLAHQVFLGPLVERDHLGHRVSQASRVIQTCQDLTIHPVHPERRAALVRRGPLDRREPQGRRNSLAMMVRPWMLSRPRRRSRSRFEPSAVVCPRHLQNSDRLVPQGGMDVILRTSASLWPGVASQRCQSTLTQRLRSRRTRSNGLDNGPFFFLFGFP